MPAPASLNPKTLISDLIPHPPQQRIQKAKHSHKECSLSRNSAMPAILCSKTTPQIRKTLQTILHSMIISSTCIAVIFSVTTQNSTITYLSYMKCVFIEGLLKQISKMHPTPYQKMKQVWHPQKQAPLLFLKNSDTYRIFYL